MMYIILNAQIGKSSFRTLFRERNPLAGRFLRMYEVKVALEQLY
jgi:hypothetical protein